MSVNSKMTALADEIRVLSGTSDAMGLDAMTTHVGDANDEIDSQTELLVQAVAALEGKAGGAFEGEGGVETCTFTIVNDTLLEEIDAGICFVDENKKLRMEVSHLAAGEEISWSVVKNSLVLASSSGQFRKAEDGSIFKSSGAYATIFVEHDYRQVYD